MALKEISTGEKAIFELQKIRDRIDLLMVEIRAALPGTDGGLPDMVLIDPGTGRTLKVKERKHARKNTGIK